MIQSYKHTVILSTETALTKADCLEKIKGFRFKWETVELTLMELASKLMEGHMTIPIDAENHKKEGFISSSLIMVDIDNVKSFTSTDIISLLTKRGLEPSLAYHTFSSTPKQERIRLVFQLSEVIEDQQTYEGMLKGFHTMLNGMGINTDKQTSQSNRVNFGGKKIFHLEANAFIDVAIIPVMMTSEGVKPNTKADLDFDTGIEVAELLKQGDIDGLREIVAVELPKDFDQMGFIERINSIEITEFFQIPKGHQFSCLFHEDNNPSAGVIHTGKNEMMHCFSCGEKLNLLGVIGKLIDGTTYDAVKVLESVLGIKLSTDYQDRMLQVTHQHKRHFRNQLETDYPELYSWMKRSNLSGFYLALMEIGLDLVTDIPLNNENSLTFFVSQRKLVEILKPFGLKGVSDKKDVAKKINLLSEVGLIVKEAEIEKQSYIDKANGYKKMKCYKFRTNYLTIPMDADTLSKANQMVIVRKEAGARNKFTSTTQTYNQDIALAGKVYSQSDIEVIGKYVSKEQELLLSVSLELVGKHGYFTEKMLSESLQALGYTKYNADKVSGSYRPFLLGYFELATVSAKLKKERGLPEELKSRMKIYLKF